jgi:ATP-dependent Lon protease
VTDAVERDKTIFLVAQKNSVTEEPGAEDVYREGTIARIIQVLKLPNGLMKILVDGVVQAHVERFIPNPKYLEAEVGSHPRTGCSGCSAAHLSLFRIHLNRNVQRVLGRLKTPEPLRGYTTCGKHPPERRCEAADPADEHP